MKGIQGGTVANAVAGFDDMARPALLICGHGDGMWPAPEQRRDVPGPRRCSHLGEKPAA
jgi:hypothetical protein